MPKWVTVLTGSFFFLLIVLISILVWSYTLSLFQMRDVITFSAPIAMCAIGSPSVLYVFGGTVFSAFTSKLPKHHKIIFKYFMYLLFAGIFSSIPIAFAVNVFLKSEGYLTCDRISWMSSTTYVKEKSLCN